VTTIAPSNSPWAPSANTVYPACQRIASVQYIISSDAGPPSPSSTTLRRGRSSSASGGGACSRGSVSSMRSASKLPWAALHAAWKSRHRSRGAVTVVDTTVAPVTRVSVTSVASSRSASGSSTTLRPAGASIARRTVTQAPLRYSTIAVGALEGASGLAVTVGNGRAPPPPPHPSAAAASAPATAARRDAAVTTSTRPCT
jgi:hypothetical protein